MSEVVLIGDQPTRHDCWEDAVQHVASATETPRNALWLRGTGDGVFLFAGPPHKRAGRVPVAWIAHPEQFQAAKSRGELESVQDFF